mmetsp:Transcript_18510/g.51849  ORF Transcript_18510/g.51849 Transcript_18510/m.51849 type:complete len:240 (+) Transcript_18510:434-1153(+)
MSGASGLAPCCRRSSMQPTWLFLAAACSRESSRTLLPLEAHEAVGMGMPSSSATSRASLIRRTAWMWLYHLLIAAPLRMHWRAACTLPLSTASHSSSSTFSMAGGFGRNLLSTYLAVMYFSFTERESMCVGFGSAAASARAAEPEAEAMEAVLSRARGSTSESSPSLSALQSHESSCLIWPPGPLLSSSEFTKRLPREVNICMTLGSHTFTSRVRLRTLLMCTPIRRWTPLHSMHRVIP